MRCKQRDGGRRQACCPAARGVLQPLKKGESVEMNDFDRVGLAASQIVGKRFT